jgi:hypothetical protein
MREGGREREVRMLSFCVCPVGERFFPQACCLYMKERREGGRRVVVGGG